jgi:hypothetical protein
MLQNVKKSLFIFTAVLVYIVLSFLPGAIILSILESFLKFSGKKIWYSFSLHLVEMDKDPDLDLQALDADPDPAK